MDLCKDKPDPGYTSLEELLDTFHPPGEAKGYLARVSRGKAETTDKSISLELEICAQHDSCLGH